MKAFKYTFVVIVAIVLIIVIITYGNNNSLKESIQPVPRVTKSAERQRSDNMDPNLGKPSRKILNQKYVTTVVLVPYETDSISEALTQQAPRIRSKNFTISPGRTIVLKMDEELPITAVEPDSDKKHFLVNHAHKGYRIYGEDGELIHILPMASQELPEIAPWGAFQWSWGRGETLVAVMEMYERRDPTIPRYPDYDSVPFEVRLYAYNLNTKEVQKLEIPSFKESDGLLRLNGVSDDGFLILSRVPHGADYWDKREDRLLGVYQIPE